MLLDKTQGCTDSGYQICRRALTSGAHVRLLQGRYTVRYSTLHIASAYVGMLALHFSRMIQNGRTPKKLPVAMFNCLIERYKMTSIAHKHWPSITAARRSHPDAVCLPFHSAHYVRALSGEPRTSQWFHAYRLLIIKPTRHGRQPADYMCISDMATAQDTTARASRLSAAAVPRQGRATSTRISGHRTQPASRSYPRTLDGH